MSIAHGQLNRSLAEEFVHCAEIDAVQDQSTGKSVAVAMPGMIREGNRMKVILMAHSVFCAAPPGLTGSCWPLSPR